jgi:O-antigen/teichoic acid export membrane protein
VSVRKHTAYNLLGALLPIGISLLTIPIYIRLIGDARYGILAIVWSLLGYFGVFNLGLGAATEQRIAALRNSSTERIARTFWTALAMNGALGTLGGLVIWPISNYFFGHVIRMGADLRGELGSALPWLMLAVPLQMLSGVLSGALQGRARFQELSIISVASSLLLQTFPLFVAWAHGPDLAWLLPAVILTGFFSFIMMFRQCKVHVFQNYLPSFSLTQARSLLIFGGWVTVTSLVSPLMVILDRFVIGATAGASAVTYYAVPNQLAERSTVLPAALTKALFPILAVAHGEERKRLAARAINSLAVVMTPLMLIALLLIEPFFRLWISPNFAANARGVAHILLLGWWINGYARVPYAQILATGRPEVIAKLHLAELIPYLILLLVGLHFWGLLGAAAAFSLRTFGDCVLLLWFAEGLPSAIKVLKTAAALLIVAFGVALSVSAGSPVWWFAASGLLLITLAWSWRIAPSDLRNLTIKFVYEAIIRVLQKIDV